MSEPENIIPTDRSLSEVEIDRIIIRCRQTLARCQISRGAQRPDRAETTLAETLALLAKLEVVAPERKREKITTLRSRYSPRRL